jgi:hypothetical protein
MNVLSILEVPMKRILLLVALLGASLAHAHGVKLAVPENAKWKEECGSCHLAYPPQLLTADDWQRLMQGLDKHFGENAVLDPKDNQEILGFLKRYAGGGERFSARSLRISDTLWFKREHDEVPSRAWSDPRIKTPANCGACHVNAARGNWSEHGIRMPAGLREEEEGEDEDDDD